ncbi:unnamed protein product [Adineta steineri]|uniref:Uncharacterized protein n=1 Tax=Adineta steineri TaxID=433720 RepID=A0A818XGU6_9BILA|nr:unnamed protein product [Adineta steineri]CAF3984278.1 unnamed protein product [Adineta steineri]
MCMEGEKQVPFNVNDLKNVVVFDIIKCETEEEEDLAYNMEQAGKGFNEIMEALNREKVIMRFSKKLDQLAYEFLLNAFYI